MRQQRQQVSQDLSKLQQRKMPQDMRLKGTFLLIRVLSLETHSWSFVEFEALLTIRGGQHPEPLAYMYRREDVKIVSPHCPKVCAPLLFISQVDAAVSSCCALGVCWTSGRPHRGVVRSRAKLILCNFTVWSSLASGIWIFILFEHSCNPLTNSALLFLLCVL